MPDNQHTGVMPVLNLLAKNGTAYNERGGFLGKLLHDFTKWAIRSSVNKIHKKMKPVIEYKEKTGFYNPWAVEFRKDCDFVIALDENPGEPFAFRGKDDINRKLFTQLKDIVSVMLEEDTHYAMRFWMLMYRMHTRWPEAYDIAANHAHAFMNYREIYAGLLERNAPLPKLEDEPIIEGDDEDWGEDAEKE